MTEAEWLASADPTPMLEYLRDKASDRKLRLFACACCRLVWQRLMDERSRRAVAVGEDYADGLMGKGGLRQAHADAGSAVKAGYWVAGVYHQGGAPWFAALTARVTTARRLPAREVISFSLGAYGMNQGSYTGAIGRLLRDLFGNPFNPSPPVPAAVLAWNDRTIPRLAEALYEERKMPEGTFDTGRIAILADALLDAGCDDDDLIQHCRSPGPHVRGCWAVDLCLGLS
jgi:hypothetical protein